MQSDLRQLEQRWGLALQSAGFGVWDLDVRAHTVHYSPQWKAMLGYADADEADSTAIWRERVHPDDLQPMLAALAGHLVGDEPTYEFEFRLRAADGSYRWVLSRGRVAARDADGAPLRAVGTLTDLTDRREAERLRGERDRAEAASQAKTEFLARMSHELRTPLNAVLGFAQLLAQRLGSADLVEQRRHVAQIEHAGWRLLHLVEDVLDMARIDRGELDIRIGTVTLAPLVQRVLDASAALAQQHAVSLRCADWPAPTAVRADAARLQQVLENLVGNAIRYNRRGGSVTVAVRPEAGAWTFSVADAGLGIPAAQIPHLFEPFNRLGRASAGGDGVGIGLLLGRSLVDMMGGQLGVQSTEGLGSTFTVTLPAA